MKLGNIVLAGAALTVALVSCSQKEEGVAVSGNPKAVTVSFANVTRSVGDKVDKDKTALYEDFYVLFTDDAGKIYKGKSADLTTDAPIYFANAAAAGDMTFHLLDNSVKKVYVIANPTDEIKTAADAATGINEIESVVVAAAAQQSVNPNDNADLVLYGVCESLVDAGTADDKGHEDYYTAAVNIKPLVARIQIGAFTCDFTDTEGITAYDIEQVALNNYYTTCTLGGTPGGLNNTPITGNVFDFFADADRPAWSHDEATIHLDNSDVEGGSNTHALADDANFCYDIFPGVTPQLLVQLNDTTDAGSPVPYYLATEGFSGLSDNTFKAGYIYNVNFSFKWNDPLTPEKCVTVNVTVEPWTVEAITPEF